MLKILVFVLVLIVIGLGIGYIFFRHEITDLLHRAETRDSKKELNYELKRKERELSTLEDTIGNEYLKSQLEEEIRGYRERINEINKKQ